MKGNHFCYEKKTSDLWVQYIFNDSLINVCELKTLDITLK